MSEDDSTSETDDNSVVTEENDDGHVEEKEKDSPPPVVYYNVSNIPIQMQLFKTPYNLMPEQRIPMSEYTWAITPYQREKNGKIGIDIVVNLLGIQPGDYILAEFSFQQPGNVRHTFEHTFDMRRNTFVYRRALTVPSIRTKNGKRSVQYSPHRFLRCTEDDEPEDGEYAFYWKPKIPIAWDMSKEAPTPVDLNEDFLKNVSTAEGNKSTFVYFFTTESATKYKYQPFRKNLVWPKASRTARYVHGRSLSLDGKWFNKWAKFNYFMANVDLLTPEDFDDFVDVLGVYYHSWNIDNNRLQEVVRIAEKFGFYYFAQAMISAGNVDVYFSSLRSVLFAPLTHPLLATKKDVPTKRLYDDTFQLSHIMIYHQSRGPPVFKNFKTKNGMFWTTSLHRKTYSSVEYLCLQLMLHGNFQPGETQLWKIEFGSQKFSHATRLPRRTHERYLNTVQRTICFPTCYYWSDVLKEMGPAGPYAFTLKVECIQIPGFNFASVLQSHGPSGITNAELQCKGGDLIHVNKEFLQDSCKFFEKWKPTPTKPNRMELKVLEYEETVHFLDHLYHASKLYTPDTWHKTFRVAQYTNCKRVADQFERGLIRSGTTNTSSMRFNKEFTLEYLKFNIAMKGAFALDTIDFYLNGCKEDPALMINDD
ncbi:hypothetical protein L5515_005764 [Caenorhabditis briggsae]|uniref:Uncharacterized protein n=2 Tax=Caenorhabditis briggsae TaxID=6238 RepID=A0AAE9EZ33_CAEBR|nr:hypothetical protein L5515_005764 [Caenorhabditis briggsae]